MESAHNKAVFEAIYEMRVRFSRAADRCKDISLSERVMGYEESADQYDAIIIELRDVRSWAEKTMHELLELT
jgi:hypothetical protein